MKSSMPIPSSHKQLSTKFFDPSPQQQDIRSWVINGSGSLFIEALAGTGKTSTLIMCCGVMEGSVAFAAFNKKIADEIKYKLSSQSNVRVGTFHSFGLSAWRRIAPHCIIDNYVKTRRMHEAIDTPWNMRGAIDRLVSIGKQHMVGKLWEVEDRNKWEELIHHYDVMLRIDNDGRSEEDIIDDVIYLASKGIEWARRVGEEIIDYDDMIWLPLLLDAPISQYDWVLVDESQDTNDARRLLARRMLKDNGRAIFVGDRNQAIYGFSGADSNAVDRIIDEFRCSTLPLTVTFRCSQEATKLAQQYVPEIVAHESNEVGRVIHARTNIYFSVEDTTTDSLNTEADLVFPPSPGDAILCRNTKPLVYLAFQLIRNGIPCYVEGRKIGESLGRLISKYERQVTTIEELIYKLEEYRRRETDRLVAMDARYSIEDLNDRIDTIIVLTEDCRTVRDVKAKIGSIFDDTEAGAMGLRTSNKVILSTIHKAKGREWNRVFILGWGQYMPSRWARQEWERRQEKNLIYVAVTRTRRDLILTSGLEGV